MKALRTLTVTKRKQVATITMHFGRALKQELKSASRGKSSFTGDGSKHQSVVSGETDLLNSLKGRAKGWPEQRN